MLISVLILCLLHRFTEHALLCDEETIEAMVQHTQRNGNVVGVAALQRLLSMARACTNCATQFQIIWQRCSMRVDCDAVVVMAVHFLRRVRRLSW